MSLLCNFSRENTNTTKELSLVVFFLSVIGYPRLPRRIVGLGFCPIVRELPRTMLAPAASVGKAEKLESETIEKYYD